MTETVKTFPEGIIINYESPVGKAYEEAFNSQDPATVAVRGDVLEDLCTTFGSAHVADILPKDYLAYMDYLKLLETYRQRISTAHALLDKTPRTIGILSLAERVTLLGKAESIFGKEIKETAQTQLTALAEVECSFRLNTGGFEGVKQVVSAARTIIDSEDLPQQLVEVTRVRFAEAATAMIGEFTRPPRREDESDLTPVGKVTTLPKYYFEFAQAVDLLANQKEVGDPKATDKLIQKITTQLARAKVGEHIKDNIDLFTVQKGVVTIGEILKLGSPDKIAKRLEKIGFGKEDLAVLTACSCDGFTYTVDFVELAKSAGWYNEKEYQEIVYTALELASQERHDEFVVEIYHGKPLKLHGCITVGQGGVKNLVDTLTEVGIYGSTDEKVKAATIATYERMAQEGVVETEEQFKFRQALDKEGIVIPKRN